MGAGASLSALGDIDRRVPRNSSVQVGSLALAVRLLDNTASLRARASRVDDPAVRVRIQHGLDRGFAALRASGHSHVGVARQRRAPHVTRMICSSPASAPPADDKDVRPLATRLLLDPPPPAARRRRVARGARRDPSPRRRRPSLAGTSACRCRRVARVPHVLGDRDDGHVVGPSRRRDGLSSPLRSVGGTALETVRGGGSLRVAGRPRLRGTERRQHENTMAHAERGLRACRYRATRLMTTRPSRR